MFSRANRADTINGILFVVLFALAAFQVSLWPWVQRLGISPLVIGIVLGMFYSNTLHHRLPAAWLPGIGFSARQILRLGVILYGFNITFQEVASIGWPGFGAAAIMMSSTLCLAYLLGVHLLGMDRQTALLTGAGSAICGAAAVLAFEPVLKAKGHQTTAAVATVVLFGTVAMAVYPFVYRLGILPIDAHGWGIYIGATVHEVAQVVGAAANIGKTVADDAVIVKMTRVLLIVPALLLLGWCCAGRNASGNGGRRAPLTVPWFALGFLGVVVFNSFRLLPAPEVELLRQSDRFLLTVAMTALGMETNIGKLKGVGGKSLALAAMLFVWLMAGGYGVVRLLLAQG